MGKNRRRKKRSVPKIKRTCKNALEQLDDLRDLASDHGITVRVAEVDCGRGKKTYHVMFNNSNSIRVLDYWPGTGKIRSPQSGETTVVADCWQALDEAARLDCEATSQG